MISFRFEGLAKDLKPSLVKIMEQEEEKKRRAEKMRIWFSRSQSIQEAREAVLANN